MTKAGFVKLVQEKFGELKGENVTAADAENVIAAFTEATMDVMMAGDSISIPKYGKFHPAFRNGKTGKVPGTDKTYTSAAKFVPKVSFAEAAVNRVVEARKDHV